MKKPDMNAAAVRRDFKRLWRQVCIDAPAYRTDRPAMRQAFSAFVDSLHRDGHISDRVANDVEIGDWTP